MKDPRTPAEWREAVALAEACLRLDSARLYGLLTGGPGVDTHRCTCLITEGKRKGYIPTEGEIEAAVGTLIRGRD